MTLPFGSSDAFRKRLRRAANYERLAWLRDLPLQQDTVLYESFSGNGMLCNPEAIFRQLLAAPDMQHLKHVWALAEPDDYPEALAEFADHPRVRFVRITSLAYQNALSTAKYLVNNATFQKAFGKREGQVYLNTWHGTPLKAMGYDVPDGAMATKNVVRNLLSSDYLLAPNDATADMYLRSYRLCNIFKGALIREGTPRIDRQLNETGRASARARLATAGIVLDEQQQVVLYAPTWKGDFYGPTNDLKDLYRTVDELSARLGDGYRVLLKVHQQVYQFADAFPAVRAVLVPNAIPTNEVLAATDLLITDYSSVFIDFLASDRPVAFYAPDLAGYESQRGFNLPASEWPGPVTDSVDALADIILASGTGAGPDPAVTHGEAYQKAKARYCPREDGHAAERVVDIVFRGNEHDHDVERGFTDGRDTILIYLGGLLPNGITASALSLLDRIDHDRFDVSVFFADTTRRDRLAQVELIHPRVRLLPRLGGMLAHKHHVQSLTSPFTRHSDAKDVSRHSAVLREEWARCFGDAEFRYIVDFSGYSPLWNKMLLAGHRESFSVWLHNDMQADARRNVNGRYPHRRNLGGMVELYRFADHLVSVSPALADVNRAKLGQVAGPNKFTYARNTINYERVLRMAHGPTAAKGATAERGTAEIVLDPSDLRGALQSLTAFHDIADIAEEAQRRALVEELVPPRPGTRTFVSAGRLSPEKNFARLIDAFGLVHEEHADTRLVILGGGPLRRDLEQQVAERGLHAVVTFAGYQRNPYTIMAAADCFVMSSDYEGQPMVLLEALVLGLPVVTTSFASVADAFPEGCGLIVESTVEALAAGMSTFLRGELKVEPFDYVGYNEQAIADFYRAIGAVPAPQHQS